MFLLFHDTSYVCFYIRMYGRGFGKGLVRVPVCHETVLGSQVFFTSGISVWPEVAGMNSCFLVTEINLYLPGIYRTLTFLPIYLQGTL